MSFQIDFRCLRPRSTDLLKTVFLIHLVFPCKPCLPILDSGEIHVHGTFLNFRLQSQLLIIFMSMQFSSISIVHFAKCVTFSSPPSREAGPADVGGRAHWLAAREPCGGSGGAQTQARTSTAQLHSPSGDSFSRSQKWSLGPGGTESQANPVVGAFQTGELRARSRTDLRLRPPLPRWAPFSQSLRDACAAPSRGVSKGPEAHRNRFLAV